MPVRRPLASVQQRDGRMLPGLAVLEQTIGFWVERGRGTCCTVAISGVAELGRPEVGRFLFYKVSYDVDLYY